MADFAATSFASFERDFCSSVLTAFSLQVFRHMFSSVAEEMGATMQRTAFSPNIKERRDFSCAVFDMDGKMVAQAAHIPVHLERCRWPFARRWMSSSAVL